MLTITTESPYIKTAFDILSKAEGFVDKLDRIDSIVLFFESLPFPAWVKHLNGTVAVVNEAYKKKYSVVDNNRFVNINQSDSVLFEYQKNDQIVKESKVPQIFEELCPTKFNESRISPVLKFPVLTDSDEMIGVAGIELSF